MPVGAKCLETNFSSIPYHSSDLVGLDSHSDRMNTMNLALTYQERIKSVLFDYAVPRRAKMA